MQTVIVYVSGGVVQDVEVPAGVRVVVRDYDVESEDECDGTDEGGRYLEAIYTHAADSTHEVRDFGPGPVDEQLGTTFDGSEAECSAWITKHQQYRPDGTFRYGVQEIPEGV